MLCHWLDPSSHDPVRRTGRHVDTRDAAMPISFSEVRSRCAPRPHLGGLQPEGSRRPLAPLGAGGGFLVSFRRFGACHLRTAYRLDFAEFSAVFGMGQYDCPNSAEHARFFSAAQAPNLTDCYIKFLRTAPDERLWPDKSSFRNDLSRRPLVLNQRSHCNQRIPGFEECRCVSFHKRRSFSNLRTASDSGRGR
jgi:hypothetical protein